MMHLLRRMRLGAKESSDYWFNSEDGDFKRETDSVVPYIRVQADEWWSNAEQSAAPDPAGM